jgi:dTDP-glucose pyrophosphorylase
MYRLIDRCCVSLRGTIRDAVQAIENGLVGIALAVDEGRRLKGTITDGDVRRALLAGATLASPLDALMQRSFKSVGPEAGRAEVLDLMQALLLKQVPVIDGEGRLIGLHVLHEIIGAVQRPNWAVVMAGGKGTRLRPITESIPKPMVRVAGRPILERLVLHLVSFGIKRVFLSINYLGGVIEEHFRDGARFGCRIEYLRDETDAMGTGGSLSLLPEKPRDPLLVLNGDLVTQANLEALLEAHVRGGYAATLGIRRYVHPVPFGCVDIDNGRVTRFEEKPAMERSVNAGLYVLQPELLARVPRRAFPITHLFEECLERGEPVGAFEIQEDWIDVGQRDQLREAQQGTPGGPS